MKGRIRDIFPIPGRCVISLELSAKPGEVERYIGKELDVSIKQWREHRSPDSNRLLWACLGEIAAALNADKWDIYLKMLKRYGKYTYILVKPEAVESMKRQWRESEVIGEGSLPTGQKMVQMLCYFGSSSYDSKEMTVLISGVISEMQEMGLPTPTSEEMRATIEEMERRENAVRSAGEGEGKSETAVGERKDVHAEADGRV